MRLREEGVSEPAVTLGRSRVHKLGPNATADSTYATNVECKIGLSRAGQLRLLALAKVKRRGTVAGSIRLFTPRLFFVGEPVGLHAFAVLGTSTHSSSHAIRSFP
jgi:hypothetical protein